MYLTSKISWCITLLILTICAKVSTGNEYGRGFFNQSRCLYAFLEGGNFEMTTADGDIIEEKLTLDSLNYESNKTKCIINNEPGRIVFSFKSDGANMLKSIAVAMRIVASPSEGYWEVTQANLTLSKAESDRKRTFPLKIRDIYAGLSHSYSCNRLTLNTVHKKKQDNDTGRIEPRATLTLERFQLQPFEELEKTVFGPSFDCAVWISVPGLMGLTLILFMISVTVVGVIFLQNIGTIDLKYTKEGQMFTDSQAEYNKRK